MFGIKEFFDYCNKINGGRKKEGLEPFKPVFGCEMYVARHRKEDKNKDNGDRSGYHLIVLAKNYNGYKNLKEAAIKFIDDNLLWESGIKITINNNQATIHNLDKINEVLNSKLNLETNRETFLHEIKHSTHGDLSSECCVNDIEFLRHL